MKRQDLACQILKIQNLKIEHLAHQMSTIQDIACQISKDQNLAWLILNIQDMENSKFGKSIDIQGPTIENQDFALQYLVNQVWQFKIWQSRFGN